jgi:hypothetical protein
MDRKSTGIDFDREAFVAPAEQASPSGSRLSGVLLLLVAIGGLGLLGYKFLIQSAVDDPGADRRTLVQIEQRMAGIEERLEQMEQNRTKTTGNYAPSERKQEPANANESDAHNPARSTYRVSPSPLPQQQSRGNSPSDPAITQKVAGIQQGLGNLQQDTAANRDAWQATTNRLADVSGQVGNQQLQMLRSQDELNELLVHTQRTALPFELHRGSERQPVGPISLSLKSVNPKTQRYTLCVYVQESCVELKERNRYEVVQFVISRYSAPLEVIATSISKDGVTGYLEVPVEKTRH